jgi:hypothetical protein
MRGVRPGPQGSWKFPKWWVQVENLNQELSAGVNTPLHPPQGGSLRVEKGIWYFEAVICFEPVLGKTCLKRDNLNYTINNSIPRIPSISVFTSSASLVALQGLMLRENSNPAARAVRGGKTRPRGRERSEGRDETTKHKGLRRQQTPRQPQAEMRAQVTSIG